MTANATDGFFCGLRADDYELPHPRIPMPVILIVRRVLILALRTLREREFPLACALEDKITVALHDVIENSLRQIGMVPGFNRSVFEAVTRHHHVVNFEGEHPLNAPDLCFRLRDDCGSPGRVLINQNAFFVECKPVDPDHAAGGCYCDKVLQRFIDGEYAWAMQDALMMAYVRSGRTVSRHLLPAMRVGGRAEKLRTEQPPEPLPHPGAMADAFTEALHRSRHGRDFLYPHSKGHAVDLWVYHSWHRCD